MCVPLYVRVICVIKVMNINKYQQTRDDVTCNIEVETEIDVHSDVKQAVKWQVVRHVTEYNTNTGSSWEVETMVFDTASVFLSTH